MLGREAFFMSSRFSSHSLTFAWRLRALGVLSSQLRLSGSVVPRSGPSLSFGDAWGPAKQSEPEPCLQLECQTELANLTLPFPPKIGDSINPSVGFRSRDAKEFGVFIEVKHMHLELWVKGVRDCSEKAPSCSVSIGKISPRWRWGSPKLGPRGPASISLPGIVI